MYAQELEDLKRLVNAETGVRPPVGPDMDRLSPTVLSPHRTGLVNEHFIGWPRWGGYMLEQSVLGEGVGTTDVADSASAIAGVGKGKHATSIVYTSSKRARGLSIRHQHEPPPSTVQSDHGDVVVGEVDTPTAEDVKPHCSS